MSCCSEQCLRDDTLCSILMFHQKTRTKFRAQRTFYLRYIFTSHQQINTLANPRTYRHFLSVENGLRINTSSSSWVHGSWLIPLEWSDGLTESSSCNAHQKTQSRILRMRKSKMIWFFCVAMSYVTNFDIALNRVGQDGRASGQASGWRHRTHKSIYRCGFVGFHFFFFLLLCYFFLSALHSVSPSCVLYLYAVIAFVRCVYFFCLSCIVYV